MKRIEYVRNNTQRYAARLFVFALIGVAAFTCLNLAPNGAFQGKKDHPFIGSILQFLGSTAEAASADTLAVPESFSDLAAGEEFEAEWDWTAPDGKPSTINWTAVVSTEGGDTNPSNDTATAQTKVRRN